MNPVRKSSRGTLVVGLACLVAAACYLWGYQTIQFWRFRSRANNAPILWITPQPLSIKDANLAAGSKLVQGDLEFEVPWTDLEHKNETKGEILSASGFVFGNGVGISVLAGKRSGLISELEGQRAGFTARLEPILGAKAIQSDFALTKAILEATPKNLRPWTSRREAMQISTLLNIKSSIIYDGGTGIFMVGTVDWSGYQFDDPARNPKHIRLELYGPQDRYLQIIFTVKKDSTVRITQKDLNRVLTTLRVTT